MPAGNRRQKQSLVFGSLFVLFSYFRFSWWRKLGRQAATASGAETLAVIAGKTKLNMNLPNFDIKPNGEISNEFLERNILTFKSATDFITKLNYGRNADKNDLKTLFADNCGTCSTKHALLKQLADENGFEEIKLVIGIFKMNSKNTSEISQTLKRNKLEFMPEAHNYLKYKNAIFDFTKVGAKPSDFENDLIEEIEILPKQISSFKVEYHKKHLQDWLEKNEDIKFDLDELWKIREECIGDLARN